MSRRCLVALVAVLAVALAGCARPDVRVTATFPDVLDLVPRAHVKLADVAIGSVTSIDLDDDLQARVTLALDPGVELPARVRARLRKTNLLGERFVELVPDWSAGGRLADGAVITDTEVVADLEELVGSASELVAAVAADHLAQAIEAGDVGLGGRGPTLRALLDDLDRVVTGYEADHDDVTAAIDALAALTAELAPSSDQLAGAIADLADAAEVLAAEDERVLDALDAFAALSRSGGDLLAEHRDRLVRSLADLAAVVDAVAADREALDALPAELAKHNRNTITGVNAEQIQVFAEMIVCGRNDVPGDPVRACDDPPQGRPRPQPRPPQEIRP